MKRSWQPFRSCYLEIPYFIIYVAATIATLFKRTLMNFESGIITHISIHEYSSSGSHCDLHNNWQTIRASPWSNYFKVCHYADVTSEVIWFSYYSDRFIRDWPMTAVTIPRVGIALWDQIFMKEQSVANYIPKRLSGSPKTHGSIYVSYNQENHLLQKERGMYSLGQTYVAAARRI